QRVILHVRDQMPVLGRIPEQSRQVVYFFRVGVAVNLVSSAIVSFEDRAKEESDRVPAEIARNVPDSDSSLRVRSILPFGETPSGELRDGSRYARVLPKDRGGVQVGMEVQAEQHRASRGSDVIVPLQRSERLRRLGDPSGV